MTDKDRVKLLIRRFCNSLGYNYLSGDFVIAFQKPNKRMLHRALLRGSSGSFTCSSCVFPFQISISACNFEVSPDYRKWSLFHKIYDILANKIASVTVIFLLSTHCYHHSLHFNLPWRL